MVALDSKSATAMAMAKQLELELELAGSSAVLTPGQVGFQLDRYRNQQQQSSGRIIVDFNLLENMIDKFIK